jgi:hypothetical protein
VQPWQGTAPEHFIFFRLHLWHLWLMSTLRRAYDLGGGLANAFDIFVRLRREDLACMFVTSTYNRVPRGGTEMLELRES